MLKLIITLLVIGLIAGAIARLIIPGKQNISILMIIVIGVIGSFVGGLLGYLIFHHDLQDGALQPSGTIGSVIGAVIVMLIVTRTGLVGRRSGPNSPAAPTRSCGATTAATQPCERRINRRDAG
jgi:uncharacterized membrane protein YeaQ/YmgE (transglycosylase-associated protein family)